MSTTYPFLPTYVSLHTYVNIPTCIYQPTYNNLCQPTVIYLPISTNPNT